MSADENQNLVPDQIDRAVLKIGALLATSSAGVVAYLSSQNKPVPMVLAIAAIIVPAVMSYFAFKAPGGGE